MIDDIYMLRSLINLSILDQSNNTIVIFLKFYYNFRIIYNTNTRLLIYTRLFIYKIN